VARLFEDVGKEKKNKNNKEATGKDFSDFIARIYSDSIFPQ
jgi:hypothetical protein